ncbi:DUF3606 domain-containing protein [Bradyrhizobium zhanjiangense]|uniref:DUF3606 domain-containing protein n=1 Tax=Bradyrhizobium zhanjiangense TaxID=1325107 RepID=A0A4Q0QEL5_9BRAD|nr:DUF3606 domain-containing protein [Bradyrhizobium zhanjiangense]
MRDARVAGRQNYNVSYESKKTGRSASAVKKVGNNRKQVDKRLGRWTSLLTRLKRPRTQADIRCRCHLSSPDLRSRDDGRLPPAKGQVADHGGPSRTPARRADLHAPAFSQCPLLLGHRHRDRS